MSTQELAPTRRSGGSRWLAAFAVLATVAILGVVGVLWWQQDSPPALAGERLTSFPTVDRSGLDDTQIRIVEVLRTEFAQQNDGTVYAEGVDEPWCADFVSWVMREAGQPLANPNSGSWRIPGVYTLTEYYQGNNRFEAPGYLAKTGDVVLYSDASAFNQHTNIVVAADGDAITTVGGNEFGRITIHRFRPAEVFGLVGYGRL
ncbi:CHAP domain-containing protein [Nocardia uniformis]|uniref:CHAP domain-containing protein n=1 Tax=Nocardia uniformis TaxID=53432 RepID=A0A849BXR2_9NOCA|nr:CHAP domain-containing protein [Nocardia uniformis]NNH69856.1 CHAP domain-containing protein [Nocardia uniformis]